MTGFAHVQFVKEHSSFDILIRSVNSRFLEVKFHLCREVAPLELELRQKIQKIFTRGTIDVTVNRRRGAGAGAPPPRLNVPHLRALKREAEQIARSLNLSGDLQLRDFLRLPGIVEVETLAPDLTPGERRAVLGGFDKATATCLHERRREGAKLSAELAKLVKGVQSVLRQVEHLHEDLKRSQAGRLRKRMEERMQGQELDEQRLLQEVAIQIERGDIKEELVRLGEHLDNFRAMLGRGQQNRDGKKLDFYTQELHREINTIGAKSQSSQITERVVEAKGLVEQIREQVQNIA